VFITAGMGGGTGTGAAPIIANIAREMGILTVAVVTKPFHFEGARRMRIAEDGIEKLKDNVDTLIVIPNQNLFRVANENTTFADAFSMADDVLHSGVRGITDLMVMPGLINLDFADVRSVMQEMGKAMMGTGEAEGEARALGAAESAIANPLLDNVSMQGARGVLINITGGSDMTLFEVDEAANRIREEVDSNANIIFGSTFSEALEGKIRVSVVATGIDAPASVADPENTYIRAREQEKVGESSSEEVVASPDAAYEELEREVKGDLVVENKNEDYQDAVEKLNREFEDNAEVSKFEQVEVDEEPVQEEEPAVQERVAASPDRPVTKKIKARKVRGLFSRVAQVARSFQAINVVGDEEEVRKEVAIDAGVLADDSEDDGGGADPVQDSMLDVPAFMRRSGS